MNKTKNVKLSLTNKTIIIALAVFSVVTVLFLSLAFTNIQNANASALSDDGHPVSGDCGDDATWKFDGIDTLTIDGTGKAIAVRDGIDYDEHPDRNYWPVWAKYHVDQIKNVIFKEGITEIGQAFCICLHNAENISIPNTVTSLDDQVFEYCDSLKHINLPNSIQKIGQRAFLYCKQLESITFPENVTIIEGNVCGKCSNLEFVKCLGKIEHIFGCAFQDCSNLKGLIIPGQLVHKDKKDGIDMGAFSRDYNLQRIYFPDLDEAPSLGNRVFFELSGGRKIYLKKGCKDPDSFNNFGGLANWKVKCVL